MLKIIELFAGIGSQTQALTNIGVDHEVVAISEIDKFCIQSYEALHGKCVNLGDICKIDSLPKADLWTYSFPCQDVSIAGNLAGIKVGTRSGLLYEVERLLKKAEQNGTLPKYLLLENVKNLVSKRFRADFDKWLEFLESLGYDNKWQILNAKDYGIPQNRERVFCVSIRGEHSPFYFPQKQELELKLKDLLDPIVDEKYYLSQKMINCFMSDGTGRYPRRERFLQNLNRKNQDVGNSVTTIAGSRPTDNFVLEYGNKALNETIKDKELKDGDFIDAYNRKVKKDVAGTITTRVSESNNTFVATEHKQLDKEKLCDYMIENKLVKEGDVVNHSYSNHRINKPDIANNENPECSPTLTTRPDTLGVVVPAIPIKNATKKGYLLAEDGDGVDISGRMEYHRGTVQKGMAQTITTAGGSNIGVVVAAAQRGRENGQQLEISDREISNAITTVQKDSLVATSLRIRKLTPRECYRLMGWNDEQINKIQATGISAAQQYKQAGNGIVVQVLEAIFKQLFKENKND